MKELNESGIYCPVNGFLESLSNVEDLMFKEEMLGPTICINPEDSVIYAPFSGTITVMYPSSHAIGITRDDGLEVLIHVGIDTVELNGVGFCSHVKQGDRVDAHMPLLAFDINLIQSKGYSIQTFIIFTNSKEFQIENITTNNKIKVKDVLCYAERI